MDTRKPATLPLGLPSSVIPIFETRQLQKWRQLAIWRALGSLERKRKYVAGITGDLP
jgi:hypothetical protein